MSDNVAAQGHYPECPCSRWPDLRGECLCSLLRACEARVREEFNQQALFVDAKAWGYRLGREDEREACIAAVEELRDENREGIDPEWGVLNMAVDALRGESNG